MGFMLNFLSPLPQNTKKKNVLFLLEFQVGCLWRQALPWPQGRQEWVRVFIGNIH